jgi:ribosome-associated protein
MAAPEFLVIDERLRIPWSELQFTYSRSPGPGGQNVNKVNTKATLHWSVLGNQTLPDAVRARFVELFSKRINEAGELVLASSVHRTQRGNIEECLSKLRHLVLAAAVVRPARKPTRPSRGSIARRLENKRLESQKKQRRRPPGRSEE